MLFWILAAIMTALATGIMTSVLPRKHWLAAALLTLLAPLAVLILYFLVGTPSAAQ